MKEWFMRDTLCVDLTWQAAAVQMLLRNSYIITSTFQSLGMQGRMACHSECQEHFREGSHMLLWPVINEKCPPYIETVRVRRELEWYLLLFKNAFQLSLGPVLYPTCALTTLNHLTLWGASLEKVVPVLGFTNTWPSHSIQLLGRP